MHQHQSKLTRGVTGFFISLLLLGAQPVMANRSGAHSGKYVVKLQLSNYASEMKSLRARDIEIAGVNLKRNEVDVIVDSAQLTLLQSSRIKVVAKSPIVNSSPDPQYKDPAKIEALVQNYAKSYSQLSEMVSIGKSLEGRPIWALKITGQPQSGPKPAILYNGMHHAREVMTPEIALDIIDYLLTNYGRDATVTHWVDTYEIWVVPMFNPDGNNQVWTSDNMWRKNTRGGYGVDLNRNYPITWNACNGSSGDKSSDTYRGASAGSEPETQAMMALVQKIRPVFDISFHSYSELVIYPYGCEGKHTETKEVVEPIGKAMASLVPSDDGHGNYTPGTAWEILYVVDGEDISWMYKQAQVIPFVVEVNSSSQGFQPPYKEWRDKTVTKMRPLWQYLLARLEGPSVHGLVMDQQNHPIGNAQISIKKASRDSSASPKSQIYRVNPDGSYHLILNPGNYLLSYGAPGKTSQTQKVTVGNKKLDLNVNLN